MKTSLLWLCASLLLTQTLMNQMDVDPPISLPSSRPKRPAASPPASSSADKRAKILLPDAQLTTLNDEMKKGSHGQMWQLRLQSAENDESMLRVLLRDVLWYLTRELASTNMKGSVIVNLTLERANDIVRSFNEDELEQWKVGVRNGVEKNDWIDLIVHRTYIRTIR
jgi:hypothetical protein